MPKIIQFLHTAVEAIPEKSSDKLITWNNHDSHRRKFLLSKGKFVGKEHEEKEEDLAFWGEWEAQSEIMPLNHSKNRPPKYLNIPFIDPSIPNRTHNTDPNVFGKRFKYIICKQRAFHNILTNLESKSIILFGSSINGSFCLDTLFVISDIRVNYNINSIEKLFPKEKRGQYYHASVNPIYDDTNYNQNVTDEESCRISTQDNYTYYEAVDYSDKEQYDGMYSFVPCKKYNVRNQADFIFRQPIINLPFIRGKQTQGIKSEDYSNAEIKDYWDEVVRQIEECGLAKGTFFNTPKHKPQGT